jgi:hypothetical protein
MPKSLCPICGEEISLFDRTHNKTKHPEFYRASRKWVNASYLCVLAVGILGIAFVYSRDGNSSSPFLTETILIFLFAILAIVVYITGKMMRLISKHRGFYPSS